MKIIYILMLLANSYNIKAHSQHYKYNDSNALKISIVGNYGDFLVDISRLEHSISVKFQVKDSVDQGKLATDPKYKRLMNLHKNGRVVWNKINTEAFIAGNKKYTVYSADSLFIQKDSIIHLNELLSRVASSKNDELVNDKAINIDGFEIKLLIYSFGVTRELTVNSPNQNSSPLIKELLHHLVLLSKNTRTHLLRSTVIKGY